MLRSLITHFISFPMIAKDTYMQLKKWDIANARSYFKGVFVLRKMSDLENSFRKIIACITYKNK